MMQTTNNKKRIVILVSGNGTNAQAIINACKADKIRGQVVAVVANKANAYALERAKNEGIYALCLEHGKFATREAYDEALALALHELTPDLVVLAGFMRILTPNFVAQFEGRMLNIHPSLLPKYPGLNTHQRALENNDKEHGASVHFVTSELDGGPLVLQASVEIDTEDNVESLAKKVAQKEWEIYPQAVSWFCSGRIRYSKSGVYLDEKLLAHNGKVHDK